jgi:hypothetical protein
MTIQKDLERLANEAMDAMEVVRDKLSEINTLNPAIGDLIDNNASVFVKAYNTLEDIYSAIEDLDA